MPLPTTEPLLYTTSALQVTVILILPFNSLAPGGFENIFQNVFFKLISWIDTLSNSCETALRSMPQNPSDDKSTLVQVMAWCHQAASHYLSQCCPRSLSPYGVTRPQWVNSLAPGKFEWVFRHVIFKQILVVDGWGISCEIALLWMSLDFTDDQSTLAQPLPEPMLTQISVVIWCH